MDNGVGAMGADTGEAGPGLDGGDRAEDEEGEKAQVDAPVEFPPVSKKKPVASGNKKRSTKSSSARKACVNYSEISCQP